VDGKFSARDSNIGNVGDDGGKRLGNKQPLASRPYICPRGFHYMLIVG
jgi:hypothetical protein